MKMMTDKRKEKIATNFRVRSCLPWLFVLCAREGFLFNSQ